MYCDREQSVSTCTAVLWVKVNFSFLPGKWRNHSTRATGVPRLYYFLSSAGLDWNNNIEWVSVTKVCRTNEIVRKVKRRRCGLLTDWGLWGVQIRERVRKAQSDLINTPRTRRRRSQVRRRSWRELCRGGRRERARPKWRSPGRAKSAIYRVETRGRERRMASGGRRGWRRPLHRHCHREYGEQRHLGSKWS